MYSSPRCQICPCCNFISPGMDSAATPAVTALARGRGVFVVLAFRFARMAQLARFAGKGLRFAQRNLRARLDELEATLVRRFLVELKSFVAHRVTLAPFQAVAIVIEHD